MRILHAAGRRRMEFSLVFGGRGGFWGCYGRVFEIGEWMRMKGGTMRWGLKGIERYDGGWIFVGLECGE